MKTFKVAISWTASTDILVHADSVEKAKEIASHLTDHSRGELGTIETDNVTISEPVAIETPHDIVERIAINNTSEYTDSLEEQK